jgi:hypothetical protein
MIFLSLLASIYSSTLFWTLGQAGSLQICTPLILDALHYFSLVILDLCLYFLDVLLGLIPERLVTLGMFCSHSSGGWKLSSHLSTRSGCGRVHGACLPPMGQNTSAFLFHDYFLSRYSLLSSPSSFLLSYPVATWLRLVRLSLLRDLRLCLLALSTSCERALLLL